MSKEGFVNIHGKEYKTVAKRVQEFREQYKDHTILTEIVQIDEEKCVMKASICRSLEDGNGTVLATGHGCEFKASSQINRTSYVENCETSAIGRALACFGLGGTEFASADEVANAIHQQTTQRAVKAPEKVTPLAGALESLDEESQQFIRDLAIDIIGDVVGGHMEDAHGKTSSLLSEEKIALWSLLDSKTRSALKKYAETLKG
jgi:hypothetical protein